VDPVNGAILAGSILGGGLLVTATIFGVRKLIRVGQFSYHNARLGTIGNPYVTKDEVLPLLDIDDPETISQTINSDLDPGNELISFRDVDRSLVVSFHKTLTSLCGSVPPSIKPFITSYMTRFEVEELKRLLRSIGTRKEPLFPVGWITDDIEVQILNSKDISGALEILEGQPVARRLSQVINKDEGVDLKAVDIALDRYFLDSLRDASRSGSASRRGIDALYQIMTDRYNIHMILRGKVTGMDRENILSSLNSDSGTIGMPVLELMIDSSGPKDSLMNLNGTHLEKFFKDTDNENMTSIENGLDRMILEGSIGLSHTFATGVGPTIRYLISKEMELRNLRVLFQGSFSGWDKNRTKNMLITEGGI
jgi:vacuolar-type H+-ATPase subunit C/Vma6